MSALIKLIFIKELRLGRFLLFPVFFALYFMSFHLKTIIFLNLIVIIAPLKFINIIWSSKEEINFYLICGKKSIIKSAKAHSIILYIEHNFILLLAFIIHGIIFSFQIIFIEIIIALNCYLFLFTALSYLLFFLNSLSINYNWLFYIKFSIMFVYSFIIIIPFALIETHYFQSLILCLALIINKLSFSFFKKNISIKKNVLNVISQ